MTSLGSLLLSIVLGVLIQESFSQRCVSLSRSNTVQYVCSRGNFPGSRCFFRCPIGYNLANENSEIRVCRCFSNRCRWSGPLAACTRQRPRVTTTRTSPRTRAPATTAPPPICNVISNINGRRVTCTRRQSPGSVCTVRCQSGYRLANSASRRKECSCSGSRCRWTGPLATCIRARTTTTTTTTTPIPTTTSPPPTTTGRTVTLPEYSVDNDCPAPHFGSHSFQVVDTWPEGGMFRVVLNKANLRVEEGWSVIISFTRDLPDDVSVLSWNSEVAATEGKYLSLSNADHNGDLTGYDIFSFSLVLLNTNLRDMAGYTALVGFYPERIENASCFALANNGNPGHYFRQPSTRPPSSTVPFVRPTVKQTRPPTRAPFTRPQRPRNTRPPIRSTHLPSPQPTDPQTTTQTSRPTTAVQITPGSDVTINRAAVRRHQGNCNVLQNGFRIKNRGYRVPDQPSNGQRFRFNADVVISGENNFIDDWTLKVVFSKRITSVEVWEAQMARKSQDGRVYIFRPLSWNAQLREDFSFLIVPEMLSESLPKAVMFLCPSGEQPDFRWNGIFRSADRRQPIRPTEPNGNSGNNGESVESTLTEEERLQRREEEIAREQRRQEEERERIRQLERERAERERNGETTNNNNSNRKSTNNKRNNNNNNKNVNQNNNNNRNNNRNPSNNNSNRKPNNNKNNNRNPNNNNNRNPSNNKNNNRNPNNNNRNPNNNNNNNNRNPNSNNRPRPTPRPTPPRRPTSVGRPSSRARCSGPRGRLARPSGQTRVNFRRSPPSERRPYDYNEVISMSILFYEAQRSGKLPANNRIPWRGDSGLRDGCDVGIDLTGGWYDAGDFVKFGLPMAWSVTTLAWGAIEFKDAYIDAGEYDNVLDSLKWVTDYFIKAHPSKYVLYGQVGNGAADHGYWGRPEEMTMERPSYKIDKRNPGTEVAAETAAAMAACAVLFRESKPRYADRLVSHARDLYDFADKYRKTYHKSITDVTDYYRSYSGFNDELVWGALWLYRATGQRSYLEDAKRKYGQYGMGYTPKVFSWDDKRAGVQVLMASVTGEKQYRDHVVDYQRFLQRARKTPKGLTWLDQWGSNRYAANGAFLSLAAAKVRGMPNKRSYINYAKSQIHYMLGGSGRSYVVGYGKNPPTKPHHRSSSCRSPPSGCSWGNDGFHNPRKNPKTLYGALIAGPNKDGSFTDDRTDYVFNEVATDYNAGFQGALAGLKYYKIQERK